MYQLSSLNYRSPITVTHARSTTEAKKALHYGLNIQARMLDGVPELALFPSHPTVGPA